MRTLAGVKGDEIPGLGMVRMAKFMARCLRLDQRSDTTVSLTASLTASYLLFGEPRWGILGM